MEGKNILCTSREIMHLCQVNKIGQYISGLLQKVLQAHSSSCHLWIDSTAISAILIFFIQNENEQILDSSNTLFPTPKTLFPTPKNYL